MRWRSRHHSAGGRDESQEPLSVRVVRRRVLSLEEEAGRADGSRQSVHGGGGSLSYTRTRLGDAQTAQDTATYQAQHQAALDAIAARNAGDFAAYSQALNTLYSLGIQNASAADNTALQQIANEAAANAAKVSLTGFVGSLTGGVGVVLAVFAAAFLLKGRRNA